MPLFGRLVFQATEEVEILLQNILKFGRRSHIRRRTTVFTSTWKVKCFYITMGVILFIFIPAICFRVKSRHTFDRSFRKLLSESTTRQSLIEGWSFLDSCYFAVISLAKVGFGDYVPHTQPPESFAT